MDLEGPPRQMNYINSYMPKQGIVIPDDPPLGCECEGGACGLRTEKTCCPKMFGQLFPYNAFGRLRVDVGRPIYECNKRCICEKNCTNRVVQKGRKVRNAQDILIQFFKFVFPIRIFHFTSNVFTQQCGSGRG